MSRPRKGGGAFAVTAIVAAAIAQGAAADTTPKADYQFHNNRDSSAPGAPPIADLGGGNAFATENVAGCATRVLTFPQGNGLVADTSGVISANFRTVILDFRLADVSDYRRLIGSSDLTSDTGLYVHDGHLDWYFGGDHEGPGAPIQPNQFVEVALEQDQILTQFTKIGYVNGIQQFSTTDTTEIGPAPRLFRDNDPPGTTGEDSAGAVFRVRVYQYLNTTDVAPIYDAGLLGDPSSCPAASATGTGKPKAAKSGKRAVAVDVGINAGCPDTGVDCAGTASVKGAGAKKSKLVTLGSASFAVPAGKSQAVVVPLGKRGKKLLSEKGKLKVTATASVTGPNGKPVTVTTAGKIKAPNAHR